MHNLPQLPYSYDALEPHIDAKTMEIHHSKHHQTYVDKLNSALEKHPELNDKSVENLLKDLDNLPEDIRTAVRNHGGGHYNHSLFWEMMTPSPEKPGGRLVEAIDTTFGNFDNFKEEFANTATGQFGSGWAWLVKNSDDTLSVTSAPNQDNPISSGQIPLLGIDVWEHAYYLKHQSKRADYIKDWWNVVNWRQVEENLDRSTS